MGTTAKVVSKSNKKVVSKSKISGSTVAKKEISKWALMLKANKAIKDEIYSLSGAIKNVQVLPENNPFIQVTEIDLANLTPAFVLKNMVHVPNFKVIEEKLYKTVTIKKVKTEVLKTKWSAWDVLLSLYYEK